MLQFIHITYHKLGDTSYNQPCNQAVAFSSYNTTYSILQKYVSSLQAYVPYLKLLDLNFRSCALLSCLGMNCVSSLCSEKEKQVVTVWLSGLPCGRKQLHRIKLPPKSYTELYTFCMARKYTLKITSKAHHGSNTCPSMLLTICVLFP